MIAWSLFSGVGGFDLGAERAGIDTALVCEMDKYARAVMRRHYPDATYIEDVRNVEKDSAEHPTVIFGGFPCQDVSIAGNRTGLAGKRSGLFHEVLRILGDVKPEWIVIENVPGLLSSNGGRDFATVIYGLAECGYSVAWRVLDSQYFGVPQRRRRVFIVGSLGNGRAARVLFERASDAGDFEPGAAAQRGTTGGAGSGLETYRNRGYGDYVADSKTRALRAAHDINAGDSITAPVAIDCRNLTTNEVSATLQAGRGLNFINPIAFNARQHPVSSEDVSMTPDIRGHSVAIAFNGEQTPKTGDNIFPTLRAEYHAARVNVSAPHIRVRRLMPVECERLQGFPDGWTEIGIDDSGEAISISDTQRYKQMGNAVTVNVAEWIFRRLVKAQSGA